MVPGWLIGGVVALGAAAWWFANNNDQGEQGFLEQTGNLKPTADTFNYLATQLGRYDPALALNIADWDGNWASIFQLQNQLLAAQQAFVDETDAFLAAAGGNVCLAPFEQAKYEDAVVALLAADGVAAATVLNADERTDAEVEALVAATPLVAEGSGNYTVRISCHVKRQGTGEANAGFVTGLGHGRNMAQAVANARSSADARLRLVGGVQRRHCRATSCTRNGRPIRCPITI